MNVGESSLLVSTPVDFFPKEVVAAEIGKAAGGQVPMPSDICQLIGEYVQLGRTQRNSIEKDVAEFEKAQDVVVGDKKSIPIVNRLKEYLIQKGHRAEHVDAFLKVAYSEIESKDKRIFLKMLPFIIATAGLLGGSLSIAGAGIVLGGVVYMLKPSEYSDKKGSKLVAKIRGAVNGRVEKCTQAITTRVGRVCQAVTGAANGITQTIATTTNRVTQTVVGAANGITQTVRARANQANQAIVGAVGSTTQAVVDVANRVTQATSVLSKLVVKRGGARRQHCYRIH